MICTSLRESSLNRILLTIAGLAVPLASVSATEPVGDDVIAVTSVHRDGDFVVQLHAEEPRPVAAVSERMLHLDGQPVRVTDAVRSPINDESKTVYLIRAVVKSESGDQKVRIEINDGERFAWIDDKPVDEKFIIERDGTIEIIDESGTVIFETELGQSLGKITTGPKTTTIKSVRRGAGSGFTVTGNLAFDSAGDRPMLGITMSDVPEVVRRQLRIGEDTKAVIIDTIVEGFPAEASGIKPFDIVIGYDAESLVNAIRERKIGDTLNLKVMNSGQVREYSIKLDKSRAAQAREWLTEDESLLEGTELLAPRSATGNRRVLVAPDAPNAPRFPGLQRFLTEDGSKLLMDWRSQDPDATAEQAATAVQEAMAEVMEQLADLDVEVVKQEKIREQLARSMSSLGESFGVKLGEAFGAGDIQILDSDRGTVFNLPRSSPYTAMGLGGRAEEFAERVESMEGRIQEQVEQTFAFSSERFHEMESRLSRIEERLERLSTLLERRLRGD